MRTIVVSLVAAFLPLLVPWLIVRCGREWRRYVAWRELHVPIWEREELRRELSQPRVLR